MRHCHDSHSSVTTPQINILAGEDHSPWRPGSQQHGTPLLSDAEISDSTASVETRDHEPANGLQRSSLNQSAQHMHPTWTEFYFSPLFLISLSVLLILMIAALEILYYISQHNQGLVTASEDMHYVWTYGPTFGKFHPTGLFHFEIFSLMKLKVLTMVAALWGQLEQRARQIMPWCLMSRGKTPSQNSLMLNYITSSTPGSLFRSLRRRHFLVSIGICGSLIFRLTIIFAAGLLRLEYRSVASERALNVEDIFDLTKKVNYFSWDINNPVQNVLNYWAIFKYGAPYPHGTTSQFAFSLSLRLTMVSRVAKNF